MIKFITKKTLILCLYLLSVQPVFSQINFEQIRKLTQNIKFMEAVVDTVKMDMVDTTGSIPEYHSFHGKNLLSFSQVSYSDSWESGGTPGLTLRGTSNLTYMYRKNQIYFQSILDGAYAMLWESGQRAAKKEDRFAFTNTFGLRATKKSRFYYTSMIDLKSQFAPGYQSTTDRTIISRLFSPAYLTTSLGISYKYEDEFSITLAPVSGRFVFVLDTTIANKGIYEVIGGKTIKEDLGFYASIIYNKKFLKLFNYNSKLELFSNYTDHPANIDVDWENKLGIKILSYLSAEFYIRLVYKDKSRYPVAMDDGTTALQGPKLQFNESFNIGLTYAF